MVDRKTRKQRGHRLHDPNCLKIMFKVFEKGSYRLGFHLETFRDLRPNKTQCVHFPVLSRSKNEY
jgi:hypothetical protein